MELLTPPATEPAVVAAAATGTAHATVPDTVAAASAAAASAAALPLPVAAAAALPLPLAAEAEHVSTGYASPSESAYSGSGGSNGSMPLELAEQIVDESSRESQTDRFRPIEGAPFGSSAAASPPPAAGCTTEERQHRRDQAAAPTPPSLEGGSRASSEDSEPPDATAGAADSKASSAAAASPLHATAGREGAEPAAVAAAAPATVVVVAAAATAPAVAAAGPWPVLNQLGGLLPEHYEEFFQFLQQKAATAAAAAAAAAAAPAAAAAAAAASPPPPLPPPLPPPPAAAAAAAAPLHVTAAGAADSKASPAAPPDATAGTSGNTAPCAPDSADSAEPAPATTCGSSGPPAAKIPASASTFGGGANVIPLALVLKSPTESTALPPLRSLPEFIRDDIQAALPNLLSPKHEKTDPNLESFVEFVLDTVLEASAAHKQSGYTSCIGLTPVQLEALRHGKYVHEEVADIWARWVARTLGATFWNDGEFLPGFPPFDTLARYLARDGDCENADKTVVLSCSFMDMLLVDDARRARMLRRMKDNISQYNRFLCIRANEGHFTTVHLTKSHNKAKGKSPGTLITAQLADSSGGDTSDPALRAALKVAVTSLFEGAVYKEGLSRLVPQQNSKNNCCFHTILYQASILSGKCMTTDNATCQQDAERLRSYTVLLAHKDLLSAQVSGVKLQDLQELRRQWEARNSSVTLFQRPLSLTNPASSSPAAKEPTQPMGLRGAGGGAILHSGQQT